MVLIPFLESNNRNIWIALAVDGDETPGSVRISKPMFFAFSLVYKPDWTDAPDFSIGAGGKAGLLLPKCCWLSFSKYAVYR